MREQFTFYRSFWEALQELENPLDRLSYLEAVIAFALDGEERTVRKKAKASYILTKPTLLSSLKKAEAGRLGGRQKANAKQNGSKTEANAKQTPSKTEANASEKEVEDEVEVEGEIEIENECYSPPVSPPRFKPPTVEEVRAYCIERQNLVNPDHFVAHYEANGWKVGRNPMKDWKAAVRTWEAEDRKRNEAGRKYPPGLQPGGSDRPGPTKQDVEDMKRFLAKLKEEEAG